MDFWEIQNTNRTQIESLAAVLSIDHRQTDRKKGQTKINFESFIRLFIVRGILKSSPYSELYIAESDK